MYVQARARQILLMGRTTLKFDEIQHFSISKNKYKKKERFCVHIFVRKTSEWIMRVAE